jgi:hypothetical protein
MRRSGCSTSPVALTASGTPVTPASLSGWTNGVWTGAVTVNAFANGVVLTANDGFGHTGTSNPFDVVTGSLHHFAWDNVASPQTVDTPFATTVRAVGRGRKPGHRVHWRRQPRRPPAHRAAIDRPGQQFLVLTHSIPPITRRSAWKRFIRRPR